MEILLEEEKETHDFIWDDYVPIVKEQINTECNKYHVYLTNNISFPSDYNKLIHLLHRATERDEIIMYINNSGGYVDTAFMVRAAIQQSKAKVHGKLYGTVASSATIITLSCDDIEIAPYTHFMVHNYSGGTGGKGHEVKAYVNFSDKELNIAFKEIYNGFLSNKEMDEIIEGKDLWLNAQEVEKRWRKYHEPKTT